MTPDAITVYQALRAVMGDVQSVRKTEFNKQQSYSFRGVDAVVNAVGPALRNHGVIVVPVAEEIAADHYYSSKSGANMRNVTLRIRWRIHGPAGDYIEAVTYGEAADSGDKAVSKAHSVALRTVLLQALCIPTDDPEPDAQAYERAAPTDPLPGDLAQAREKVRVAFREAHGTDDIEAVTDHFGRWSKGGILLDAEPAELRRYAAYLSMNPDPVADADGEPPVAPASMDRQQQRTMFALFKDVGLNDKDEQLDFIGEVLETTVESRTDPDYEQADKVIAALRARKKAGAEQA